MTIINTLVKEHEKNKKDIVGINSQLDENMQQISDLNKNKTNNVDFNNTVGDLQNSLGGDVNSIWIPPIQPNYNEIVDSKIPDTYYKYYWDTLLIEGYSRKEFLGKDQTGTYDIFRYVFEPKNYEKTIIISANVHGWEVKGQKILYRFMQHVINDSNKYPQLNYMRNKVRIVIIPIANPWGLFNYTRENGRNVDINRNFSFRWENLESDVKGSTPLSEVETQYINNTIIQYTDSTTVSYIDIHNTNYYTPMKNEAHYYCAVPSDGYSSRNFLHDLMEQIKPKDFNVTKAFDPSSIPISINQASIYNNLHSVSCEWMPGGIYGVLDNTKEDVREGLKFIGNTILRMTSLNKKTNISTTEPFTIEMNTNKTDIAIASGEYTDVRGMSYTFTPPCEGIMIINSSTTFVNVTNDSQNFSCIVVNQPSHPIFNNSALAVQRARNEIYAQSLNKTITLNSSRMVEVFAKSETYGDVTVKLQLKCDTGTINHRRSRMYITFIPSDCGRKYSLFEPNSSGDMVQVF